jgi:hypothetical protein
MNLHGFEQDFTSDLESFASGMAERIIPYTIWAPRKTAAPERHHVLGSAANISIQTQIHLLDTQNPSFEIIESLLRLYMNPVEYSMLSGTIDEEKEQVWLFAIRWLTHYYECLTEPLAIRTEFYRQSHNKFLNLMRMMLQYTPGRRITFMAALRSWYPDSEVLGAELEKEPEPEQEPEAVLKPKNQSTDQVMRQESVSLQYQEPQASEQQEPNLKSPDAYRKESQTPATEPARKEAQTPVSETATALEKSSLVGQAESYPDAHPPLRPSGPVASAAVSSATSVRSRLVLKRLFYSEGRSKTRKSPRN